MEIIKRCFSSKLLKLLVSLTLLIFVLTRVNLGKVFEIISSVPIYILLLYLLITVVLVLIVSWRWSLFLTPPGRLSEIFPYFRSNMLAYFYNLFLPSSSGGDAVKWVPLLSLGYTKSRLIFSVVLDKLIVVISIVVVGFCSLLVARLKGTILIDIKLDVLFGLAFLLSLASILFVCLNVKFSDFIILRKFRVLKKTELYLRGKKRELMYAFILSFAIQIISHMLMYVLSSSMGLPIRFVDFLIYGSMISLILVFPISFSGFGVTEFVFVYFYTQIGASSEGVLALTSLLTIFKIILAFLGWSLDFIVKILK